jgi:hypothetical protein
MPLKNTKNNNRIYFITKNTDEDLNKLNKALFNDNFPFVEKVYKSSISNNSVNFINISINTEIDEDIFIKICNKLNKIMEKSYKMFYKDNKNKFVFVPTEITQEIKKSLNSFIEDE